jgi:hypothetical protein
MHTTRVIAGGFLLLALCLLTGRWTGSPTPAVSLAKAAKLFVPLWFVLAAINMWIGVSKAGYSVAEETPTFAVVFAVPVAAALLVWWSVARG